MFPAMNIEIGYVSLLRSEENLLELAFYKHHVPPILPNLGDEGAG